MQFVESGISYCKIIFVFSVTSHVALRFYLPELMSNSYESNHKVVGFLVGIVGYVCVNTVNS